MKREKIYDIPIDKVLDEARRDEIEKNIFKNADLAPKDFEFGWDEEDDDVLYITISPAEIEVNFLARNVEVYATLPLWAKMAFTEKRKGELRLLIETILRDSDLITNKA